jgi:hypothetical protein
MTFRIPVFVKLCILSSLTLISANALSQTTQSADPRIENLEKQLNILSKEVEKLKVGDNTVIAEKSQFGFSPGASKVYQTESGLSFGGYGEMLYESKDSRRDNGQASGTNDQIDFLRSILYVGYKFNERFILNTEYEFEHAATDKSGSVSVEFAYLDAMINEGFNLRAGLLLVPMGLVNLLHEPTVFLAAKRSKTESSIIPTTWRENGAGFFGQKGKFSYQAYVLASLDANSFSASGLRGGRQKGSKSKAEDFSYMARVDYQASEALMVGGSHYRGDAGQSKDFNVQNRISEIHATYKDHGWDLSALFAHADVNNVLNLNNDLGLTGASSVGEELYGYYIQAGYNIFSRRSTRAELTPFVRYENYDLQDKVPNGFSKNLSNEAQEITYGIAYKPIPQIVVKADYQDKKDRADGGIDQFNLALGYIF